MVCSLRMSKYVHCVLLGEGKRFLHIFVVVVKKCKKTINELQTGNNIDNSSKFTFGTFSLETNSFSLLLD